ncbi:unnamed protein product [Brassica rapa subsp. trilocularis]
MGISLACDVTDESSFNNKHSLYFLTYTIGRRQRNDKEHNSGRSHYYMELSFFLLAGKRVTLRWLKE